MGSTAMKTTELTIHMIGNAHLDPVWLWHWQRGSDEALATCRAACDLLDDFPDATFTRGEAWVYEQIRVLDPELLDRIRAHVEADRWEVTGGWWVQSDTNLPTADALRKNIALGKTWFRQHMGITELPVAYLVDSFGHGSYLPRVLQENGQRYFVMMRPGPHEKSLPSSLFRWRSPDGSEALTFRIAGAYLAPGPDLAQSVEQAVSSVPQGVNHMMCFYGVGDHGGGPTRAAVRWIQAHRDFAPDVRLEFSSTAKFFAAAEPFRETCTVVEGELEPHAIGCYSVCGELKRETRSAELTAHDAEALVAKYPTDEAEATRRELDHVWRTICFNQFHDIVTGSAIRDAIAAARAQIGEARSRTDRLIHTILRKDSGLTRRCAVQGHRVHVVNRTNGPWAGLVEGELWTDWNKWDHHLEDENGVIVPSQCVASDALVPWTSDGIPRLLIPLELGPLEHQVFRLMPGAADPSLAGLVPTFDGAALDNGLLRIELGRCGVMQVSDVARGAGWATLASPLSFQCRADDSDTWSHGLERFCGPVMGTAVFESPVLVESGALRTTARMAGRVGNSRIMLFVSLVRGEKVVHLRLAASYQEPQSVLKAVLSPHFGIAKRLDRVAGGWHERVCDGKEYALHHAILTGSPNIGAMALALPDSFAVDCQSGSVCPTLIRNSVNAYDHVPADLRSHPRIIERLGTDEGPHSIRLALAIGEAATQESLESLLGQQQRQPYFWDDYNGGTRLDGGQQ